MSETTNEPADSDDLATRLEHYKSKCELYESWLRALDEHAKFGVYFKDAESRYLFVNKYCERSFGRSRDELLNRSPEDVFGGDRACRLVAMDNKVIAENRLERIVPCDESGCLEMHEEHRFAVRDAEGRATGIGCFAFETTDKSLAEEALAQAQRIAELGNWRWSVRDRCLISCSVQFAEILGVSLTEAFELMQDKANRLVHPDDAADVAAVQAQLADPSFGGYEIEYRIIRRQGDVRHVREIAEPMMGNNGAPVEYIGTLQDISRQKSAELALIEAKQDLETRVEARTAELKTLASRDPLTGLLNRTEFREAINRRFAAARRETAVILLDLNGFKHVNDCYGHSIGDALLRLVANRLDGVAGDAFTARLGGDEFGVAIECVGDPRQDAFELCALLRQALLRPIDFDGRLIHIDSAFGVSILGRDADELEEVMKFADIALYRAKDSAEAIIAFEPKMAEAAAHRRRLEEDLRLAIRNGEIYVAYQPQVLTRDESLIGVEALARWRHVEFGEIAPGIFVGIAEECGLIDALGEHILDTACAEIGALTDEFGANLRLSVNISTKQFYDQCLASRLASTLSARKFDPRRLEIEVTETVFARNMDEIRAQLNNVRAMGATIALDDFGTGYSSLSYLRQFSVDRIKLDREFIRDIAWSKYDQQILHGIIKLAQSLEIETIAEGVEDDRQLEVLERYGCDEIQGFYFGRPMPIDRLRQMLRLHRAGERDAHSAA